MSVAVLAADKRGEWTFEEFQLLPGRSGWRYEVVDGALVMSPGPGRRHETVAELLRQALRPHLGPARIVLGPMTVDLEPSYRLPDLVVVDRRGDDAAKLLVGDVHLVVEVVSPSSRTTDRVTKPAEYAAHGLRAFWRVEIDGGVSITAYVLRDGDEVYTELGCWGEGETLVVGEPFDLTVVIDDLVP